MPESFRFAETFMNSPVEKTNTPAIVSTRWIVIGFAGYALLGSISAFLGWMLHQPRLTDWVGSGIAMFPNAALCAGCAALALMVHAGRRSLWASRIGFILGAITFLIGAATLFEHITGVSLGIDNLLFETTWGRAAVAPGRMGPPASSAFTLLGLAILLSSRSGRTRRVVPILALIVFALVTLSITGYAFGADRLYAIARYTGIALPTATGCLTLAIAVMVNVPECEPARTLFRDSAAGMLLRRALFFILPMPFLLGWLCVRGQERGLFDSGMGTALLIICLMFMLCGVVWWSARAVQKRESAVRESDLRFRTMADSTPTMIWVTNARGEIEFVNRAYLEFFGVSPEQVRGPTGWHPLLHPEDSAAYIRAYASALQEKRPFIAEGRVRHADGTWRWIASYGAPRRSEAGEFIGHVGSSPDITSVKEVQEALRVAHEQLGNRAVQLESLVQERTAKLQDMVYELEHVSYAITHDMRAPLRAMSAFAALLLEHEVAGGNAETIEFSQRIISAANRLDKLIQDSLHYTTTVLQEMSYEPVELQPLVEDLLATYPNLQREKADVRIDGVLPRVMGSEALLTQCFSNLLGNAVKFVPAGRRPQIRIRVENGDSTVRIWIEDNGIGIPQHAHDRLFKMFQRMTNEYEGSGVGLAIVRKVVERMGGKVGVESEPGEGSRFWLEFPVAPLQPGKTIDGANTPELSSPKR